MCNVSFKWKYVNVIKFNLSSALRVRRIGEDLVKTLWLGEAFDEDVLTAETEPQIDNATLDLG